MPFCRQAICHQPALDVPFVFLCDFCVLCGQDPALRIFCADHFVLPLPEGHRCPLQKYSLLRERVMQAGLSTGEALREPHAATDEEILRVQPQRDSRAGD